MTQLQDAVREAAAAFPRPRACDYATKADHNEAYVLWNEFHAHLHAAETTCFKVAVFDTQRTHA